MSENESRSSKPAAVRRQRARTARTGRGRALGVSRIFIGAVVLAVIAATFMFWPSGRRGSGGVGERRTVVTAGDSQLAGAPVSPRSGDVDLDDAVPALVPEGAGTTDRAERDDSAARSTAPASGDAAAAATARPQTRPPDAGGTVAPAGGWTIQVAAFTSRENADRFLAGLVDQGFAAYADQGRRQDGSPIWKIRVGGFADRAGAAAYLDEHRQALSRDALVIKR